MEGLEVSIVNYSQIINENRYDSEFFKAEFIEVIDKYLKGKPNTIIGSDYKVTDGEHGSVTLREDGIKYLTAENIKNGYVDVTSVRYVDDEVDRKNARARVNVGDILISIKGTLGEVAVAEKWLLPANMNRDVAILKPINTSILSEYLAIFMMSKYGAIQSLRGGSGAVQQMITLERLRGFVVPVISESFQKLIKYLYSQKLISRQKSLDIYKEAESLLLSEIGFDGFVPSADNINTKNYSESFLSSGRLDPEYYQPKYEQYEQAVLGCSLGYTLIQDEFVPVKEGTNLTNSEYKYIEIGDVNVGDGSCNYTIRTAEELPANAKYLVQKGDLLISKVRPNRGAVTIIPFDEPDLIVSGAFTVLRAKPKSVFSNETLKVLLRTNVYIVLPNKNRTCYSSG